MTQVWTSNKAFHIPVLKDQIVQFLNIRRNGIYLDGTLGLGGHSAEIISILSKKGAFVGFDRDEEAIIRCKTSLPASSKCHLVCASYDQFPQFLESINIKGVDGILLDLGISSMQLDSPERGFSYRMDGPLDMRFNRKNSITAKDILNTKDETYLAEIFRKYGEERNAKKIAKKIVDIRMTSPLTTTLDLKNIIQSVSGDSFLTKTLSRIFQALRIAVNDELTILKNFLNIFADYLNNKGRIAIISYHSLEDRLVKQKFKELEKGCVCPPDIPICQCGIKPSLKVLTKRPIVPSEEEVRRNRRARAAKLRVAEKII